MTLHKGAQDTRRLTPPDGIAEIHGGIAVQGDLICELRSCVRRVLLHGGAGRAVVIVQILCRIGLSRNDFRQVASRQSSDPLRHAPGCPSGGEIHHQDGALCFGYGRFFGDLRFRDTSRFLFRDRGLTRCLFRRLSGHRRRHRLCRLTAAANAEKCQNQQQTNSNPFFHQLCSLFIYACFVPRRCCSGQASTPALCPSQPLQL